jgi:uncharacterized repeat protein (TIGR03806 family)
LHQFRRHPFTLQASISAHKLCNVINQLRRNPHIQFLYVYQKLLLSFCLALTCGSVIADPVAVLTYHNDNDRSGANTNETILTPANVKTATFGKLFSYNVDGQVYAQPLLMTNVTIPGGGVFNVLIVCTEHNTVYGFNADSNTGGNGGLLWRTNLGVSAIIPNQDFGNRYGPYSDITVEMGITATPVIDPSTGTLYVDAFTHEGANYLHRIHALDVASGTARVTPVVVAATINGVGVGSSGGKLRFDPIQHFHRSAMTFAGGILFSTYTGYSDTDPYHGWIFGYDPTTLQFLTNYTFNTSPNSKIADWGPNAGECGIWMSGNGPCADNNTNLYFEVGNGPFNADTGGTEYGDSFVKLSTTAGKFSVADYFTPFNQESLASADADLGSGGALLLPDSVGSATHRHLMVGCGKEGKIYLVDRDNMGHYNPNNDSQIVQTLGGAVGGTWSSPAYWNNRIYYHGNGDVLKAFRISNASINSSPTRGGTSFGYPGATPSISANGTNNGIVWVIQPDGYDSGGPAVLRAYNATNVSIELYNSSQNLARDNPGVPVKFGLPIIANGKVYMGAQYVVSVFGPSQFVAVPTILPNGGVFTNSVTVTLACATPGAAIYYSLDGSTPTTSSILYTAPFTLTNNVVVKAFAVSNGSVSSGIATAGFINSALVGSGIGLTGYYWSNVTAAQFSSPTFSVPATLVRTDATVDFDWGSSAPGTVSPDPRISSNNFTIRWVGCLQPQFDETYTLYVTVDDGVRLYLNGQRLIDQWNEQDATFSKSVPLKAQQKYNVQIDYFEHAGGGLAHLAWSSPSTAQAIIPSTQLFPFTNPPPGVVLQSPAPGDTYTAPASVTFSATAAAQYNAILNVSFYANSTLIGVLSNSPYVLTKTGLPAGAYAITAVATDGSSLMSTSAPVNITVLVGTGAPYGLTNRSTVPAYFNMPTTINGTLPALLSQVGVFSDTPAMTPTNGLIPYSPNTPLWSDGAVKTRWFGLPYRGGVITPDQQIGFAPNGEWTFPAGTVFVKHFDLATDETNAAAPLRRLETRVLVRDPNGSVYGVTYKWRPDNSNADLLSVSQTEEIAITNAFGVRTQSWYYPSPSDCLACHTPAAKYVLGLKTRQLNGTLTYPDSGVTDNQIRTFNELGLLNPAINETNISSYAQLVALTDTTASITNRFRSYIDANCAQCHRPGGAGTSFDARYDTPLNNQTIINGAVLGNLGYDNAHVVTPQDIWRSMLYQRANSLEPIIKMPPLARNVIDTNGMTVIAAFINSLPGTPALAPPTLLPASGNFVGSVNVTLGAPDLDAVLHYTLDGSLPTSDSPIYSGAILITNSLTLTANAAEVGFNTSVAARGVFTVSPPIRFTSPGEFTNGNFQVQISASTNQTYILQGSTNLVDWVSIDTNSPAVTPFYLLDPNATNFNQRYYRVQQPQ